MMKLYTHTDFDGLVSGLLLKKVYKVSESNIEFVEHYQITQGTVIPTSDDIVADLPEAGGIWFDHHATGRDYDSDVDRQRYFDPTEKSCARIIFNKHKRQLQEYSELVDEADKIDSASLTKQDILNPGPAQIVSITLRTGDYQADQLYLYACLRALSSIALDNMPYLSYVKRRYAEKMRMYEEGEQQVKQHINVYNHLIFINLTKYLDAPKFRHYKMHIDYPDKKYFITIYRQKDGYIKFSMGYNIFHPDENKIHIGDFFKRFHGGGHKNVGGAIVPEISVQTIMDQVFQIFEGKDVR